MGDAVDEALYTKFTTGTALITALGGTHVWNDIAPQNAAMPYLLFKLQYAGEETEVPVDSERRTYAVQVVDRDLLTAQNVYGTVHSMLHHGTLTITGYTCFWMMRQSFFSYVEADPAGGAYGHAGGVYIVRVERAR